MRLKSLKLSGFKSFANTTVFDFKHDVTAIVGPNGCGKSNVIDAIRWVLGESSAKQLRGGAMSDVIFAGTDGKAGKSLASVELTFEHTQDENKGIRHALNLYHELTLRRQISLDGKSDYFINNQKVRRRDVIDVFLGTGLGARSYAVIEQGMIGRIIDADGKALREFIEEAAGVSRYQARRDETVKQLQQASDNLSRLTDLHSELAKQQKTLEKQAKSASEYELIKDELAQVQKKQLFSRLFYTHQETQMHQSTQKTLTHTLDDLTVKMDTISSQLQRVLAKSSELLWQKDDSQNRLNALTVSNMDCKNQLDNATRRLADIDIRLSELDTKQRMHTSDIDSQQAIINEHRTYINDAVAQLDTLNASLNDTHAKKQALSDTLEQLQKTHRTHSNHQKTLQNDKAVLVAKQHSTTAHIQKLTQKKQTLIQNQPTQIEGSQSRIIAQKIDALNASLNQIDQTLDEQNEVLAIHQKILDDTNYQLSLDEKNHATYQAQYNTIHALVYPKPTKTPVADSKSDLPVIKDSLTLSELGQDYADVLDKVLGRFLNACFVTMEDLSNTQSVGQSVWFDNKSSNTQSDKLGQANHLSADFSHKDLWRLDMLIKTPNLAVFQDIFVIDKQATGYKNLSVQNLFYHFGLPFDKFLVLPNGDVVCQYGLFAANNDVDNSDFLQTRTQHLQKLDELETLLTTLETNIDKHQKTQRQEKAIVQESLQQIQSLNLTYKSVSNDKNALQLQLAKQQSDEDKAKIYADNYHRQLSQIDIELGELHAENTLLDKQLQDINQKIDDILPVIQGVEQKLSDTKQAFDEQNTNVQSQDSTHRALTAKLRLSEQKVATAQAILDRLNKDKTQYHDQKNTLCADKQALHDKQPMLQAQFDKSFDELNAQKAMLLQIESVLDDTKNNQNTLDAKRTALQQNIDELGQKITQNSTQLAVATARLGDIAHQIKQIDSDFNLDSQLQDFLHDNFDKATISDDKLLAQKQSELSAKLSKIGAVNLSAKQELDELNERLLPMDNQMLDVKSSIDKLNSAISEIDKKTKTLFLASLNAVNQAMNTLFVKIFGGGQASLQLIDDDNLKPADKWQAGLVLMAQPLGKKNSRLAVLSGGEKTLTALSLIFAIFKQNPAPFCVLDEVDAPLDDANVARFTGLIDEMRQTVQFIFISHNKLAMQSAGELKGVTMPNAGVSTLVSVDIEQASSMLD